MEGADLVRLKCTNDAMQQSSVMEENKVSLLPIVGVNKLFFVTWNDMRDVITGHGCLPAYLWRNGRSLHLVQQCPDLSKILDVCPIWVQGPTAFCACWKRVDDEFLNAARVNLEVEVPRNRVFPQLSECCPSVIPTLSDVNRLTTGNVLTLDSSQSGSSLMGSSRPSVSIPKPVGSARAGAIQT